MKKSWADHCSSDEESFDDGGVADLSDSVGQLGIVDPRTKIGEGGGMDDHHDEPPHGGGVQQPEELPPIEMLYDLPDRPPFTAFIGNLAFSIKEPDQLKFAIMDAVEDHLNQKINVIEGRVATDRSSGKHRGFGYVEVETLDDVSIEEKFYSLSIVAC